jgi:hypothetical protein
MTDTGPPPLTLPPHLDHDALAVAQQETLSTPRRPYGLPARVLFALLDVLYGRARTLSKFKVLELVARVPYQSWEQVAYIAITHVAPRPVWPGASTTGWRRPGSSRTTSNGIC